ncbi:MAG TPA: UDP-3-O-(3-hydroxymyristoyl)glucosamine N-acyltransferase [Patescibacteria group bacterium]|nr:UDP-3-O-(3-hydroxymyristoyl)glucosamine N-acyltransferase [Patescibacteria group bacterium]
MKKSLRELAEVLGGEVLGDADLIVSGVTNIEDAGPGDITFAVEQHLPKAAASQAVAVIVPPGVNDFSKPAIRVPNPRAAFSELLTLFTPVVEVERGIHPTAIIAADAVLGADVAVMAYVVIDAGTVIGDRTVIYPHSYIGRNAMIGSDVLLHAGVTVYEGCRIGDRSILHSGAVVGSDGFGFVTVAGRHRKVPQVGNVVVGEEVEIGAHSAIDRATTGSTLVGNGTKIDNFVHLAHNVTVGENCFFVAFAGIAGSAKIGNNVTFAGQSACNGHINIGDNCVFAGRAAPISDVPANSFYAGFPARPHREWLRTEAATRKIPELQRTVREMERRLAELEERLKPSD